MAEALRQAGHSIFLDSDRQDGIVPGADWSRTLFHKLRLCDAVVFLNSSGSQASKWCHTEVVVAADLGKRRYWLDVEEGVKSPAVLGPVHGIRLEISLTDSTRRLVEVLRRDGLAEHSMARWDESRSPYPGLEAMDVLDAGVFFGREADVHRLVERVAGPLGQVDGDLVVVVGPSGAGKSSLVRAGLAARLASAGTGWAVLEPFEPGLRPLDRLVKRLVDLSGGQLQEAACRAELGADGLGAVADRLLDRSPAPARRLLVIIDQAEQLATVGQGADREAFVAILATGLGPGSPVTVVMTVRSDRFEDVHGLPVIGGAIHESFVVASLDRSQLAAVIEGPARRADMTFETGLVGQLIDDAVRGGSDNAVDSLPLLAFTLREAYDLAVAQDARDHRRRLRTRRPDRGRHCPARRRRRSLAISRHTPRLGGAAAPLRHRERTEPRHRAAGCPRPAERRRKGRRAKVGRPALVDR